MQPFQRFRQGNLVLSLAVRQDRDGRFYSQLCDVQEAFPGASLFKLEEVILNFLEDENRQKFEPKRVDHFPDHIIDVICRASFQNAALSSSHAAQLLSTEGIERLVSQLSIQPSSFSTKSRTLARSSTFSPASSASSSSLTVRNVGNLGTHQALVAARPMAALSAIASDITHIQHQLDRSADQQSAYHQQLLERLVHLLEEQADAKARDECVLAELTAARLRDEEVLRLQKQTIDRLIMAQQRIEAILVQNYELHEYPIPRLFVLLPDSYEKWDPRNVLAARFRLFFLCECGDFCTTPAHAPTSTGQLAVTSALPTAANAAANAATTTPITVKNSIHLAKHGGYELTRPTEFFDQYGPYVLGMLRILKHCLAVAAVISPVVALADSGVKDVMDGVKSVSESTMAAVDMSIDYLEKKLDDNDAGDDAAEDSDGEVEGRENMFNNLAALEGADLRRLDTFLRNNDIDKVLGNLYRITLATGEVKWVCLDHYRQIYRETAMASFVQSLEANGGTYEPHIGKVTIAIKSRAVFKDFFSRLSIQASSVSVLKTTFNWSFGSGDLAKFVEQISESNIRDLQVEFAEVSFAESLTQTLRPGKGKYYSLLRLLSNSKIKGLSLTNVALTGLRTSSLRTLPRSSLLQSFHFIGDVDSNDADRLVDIITHCTCLVDLRVGSAEAGSPFLSKVDLAISTLSKLKALHRYRLYRPDVLFNEIPDNAAPYGSVALKELVDTSMSFPSDPTGLLECAIRRSVATLEVLVLSSERNIRPLDVKHIFDPLTASTRARQPYFARLTHLELMVDMDRESVEWLGILLRGVTLVHIGVNYSTGYLLQSINLSQLNSVCLREAGYGLDGISSFVGRSLICSIESVMLISVRWTRTLSSFLSNVPLKRLLIDSSDNVDALKILTRLHLPRLQLLTILRGDQYTWEMEAALAAKNARLADDFLLQLGLSADDVERDVHDTTSRTVQGSPTRLSSRRVRIARDNLLTQEYYSLILPPPSR